MKCNLFTQVGTERLHKKITCTMKSKPVISPFDHQTVSCLVILCWEFDLT